jgi:hypothetical protein
MPSARKLATRPALNHGVLVVQSLVSLVLVVEVPTALARYDIKPHFVVCPYSLAVRPPLGTCAVEVVCSRPQRRGANGTSK